MSSPPRSGGSSYVPPHKRGGGGGGHDSAPPSGGAPSGGRGRGGGGRGKGGGRGAGGGGGRRGRSHSPKNSPQNSGRKQHNNNNNQHHNQHHNNNSHSHDNHHHHHHYYDKKNKELHRAQVKLLQESLTRICCINLERREDRWKSFQQHLQQSLGRKDGHHLLQHKMERFNAVDGIPADDSPDAELLTKVDTTWDATINAKWDRHISPPMTKEMSTGEVGCALSHIKLWRELVATADKMKHEAAVAAAAAAEADGTDEPNETTPPKATAAVSPSSGGVICDDILLPPPVPPSEIPITMMIMEDDSLFYSPRLAHVGATTSPQHHNSSGSNNNHNNQSQEPYHPPSNHDFWTAFQLAWTQLPEDWDIWYLGFSDRGERVPVDTFEMPKPHHHHHHNKDHDSNDLTMTVQLFKPTYGFHTHAYVLTSKAAQRLLDNLPVKGPLDVWLADNQWFDLNVYCSVIEHEGWQNTGAWLVTQNRKAVGDKNSKPNTKKIDTDIGQSGRKKTEG